MAGVSICQETMKVTGTKTMLCFSRNQYWLVYSIILSQFNQREKLRKNNRRRRKINEIIWHDNYRNLATLCLRAAPQICKVPLNRESSFRATKSFAQAAAWLFLARY